jgi:hypothetical protein
MLRSPSSSNMVFIQVELFNYFIKRASLHQLHHHPQSFLTKKAFLNWAMFGCLVSFIIFTSLLVTGWSGQVYLFHSRSSIVCCVEDGAGSSLAKFPVYCV